MVKEAIILVRATPGNHDALIHALAEEEDQTCTTYRIKGMDRIYESKCKDHDAVVAVSAKNKNEITKIEKVILNLTSSKAKGPLVSKTHVCGPLWIKARGDP